MTPPEILAELDQAIAQAAPEELPALVGRLEAAKAAAWARLVSGASLPADPGSAENLPIAEAARRLGMSRDWMYRNAARLPFAVKIGRRVLFDARGLERWNRSHTGR